MSNKPTEFQKKSWTLLTFLVKFLILAIPLHFLLWINIDTTGMQIVTASQTAAILSALGLSIKHEGIRIFTDTFTFVFIRDCTAWKAMLAFFALVVATPFVKGKNKMKALGIGLPLVYLANLVRTASTIYVGVFYPGNLEFVHTILWREMMLLFIFGMWIFWFKRNKGEPTYGGLDKLYQVVNKFRLL